MPNARPEWIGSPGGAVADELDARHEALLTDITDVRQCEKRLEQTGEQTDFWLESGERPLLTEDLQIGQCDGAAERIAGVTMSVEKCFELVIRP